MAASSESHHPHTGVPSAMRADPATLIRDVARCWRKARDGGACVQQSLHRLLSGNDWGMLAPVFDSLMALCETALGRRFAVGTGAALAGDEALLLGLVRGGRPRTLCEGCPQGVASALDCALCSTRIMIALTMQRPEARAR